MFFDNELTRNGQNAKNKLSSCTNDKEYAEQMKCLALQVLVEHTIENEDFFAE